MKQYYLILLLLLGLLFTPALANKGSIVVGSEYISVEETKQRAIVAWNGTEEVIILSTDMKSSHSAVVLEVIPLPSNPTVHEGSSESFETLARLLNEKTRTKSKKGVEITFYQKIGAHDVTVVKVTDLDYFVEWVTQFLQKKGASTEIPSDFKNTVSHYLEKSINYFVFDVVDLNESVQSINPLVYRFESRFLYYPLEITATSDVGHSHSEVTLFLITEKALDKKLQEHCPYMRFTNSVEFTQKELTQVSPVLEDLFGGSAFVMNAFYVGPLDVLTNDIIYPEYGESVDEPETVASGSIARAFSLSSEPEGHTKVVAVLWVVILLLVLVAINRSQ